jgi:hypothetical protein
MRKFVAPLLLFTVSVHANADTTSTHCKDGEGAFFNCFVKGTKKVASLCGGYSAGNKEYGYLQYRFGPIGNPEFKYPATTDPEDTKDKFNSSAGRGLEYEFHERAVQFTNLNYSYILYFNDKHVYEKNEPAYKNVYSSSIAIWKMADPCLENCPPRARHAMPDAKEVKTLICSNGDAGIGLYDLPAIRLKYTPGHATQVTLPTPENGTP